MCAKQPPRELDSQTICFHQRLAFITMMRALGDPHINHKHTYTLYKHDKLLENSI